MTRDEFLRHLVGLAAAPLTACAPPSDPTRPDPKAVIQETPNGLRSVDRWRALLPPEEFQVLFEGWTEPPGSSPLNKEYRDGTYVCAACHVPLFDSRAKYDSKTGWPTFWKPLEGRVATKPDHALSELRTEYHCARCGGHQGHVFEDGPPPTGQRYCNNGLALRFVAAGHDLPTWR